MTLFGFFLKLKYDAKKWFSQRWTLLSAFANQYEIKHQLFIGFMNIKHSKHTLLKEMTSPVTQLYQAAASERFPSKRIQS